MALIHHGSRNYNEAAGDAANRARVIIEDQIQKGQAGAQAVIDKVMREVPTDFVTKAKGLGFRATDKVDEPVTVVIGDGQQFGTARNAFSQLLTRADLPASYATTLATSDWGRNLLAHNLAEVYQHDDARYLARTYDGRLRGFLSNRYRRIDSRPCLEAVAGAFWLSWDAKKMWRGLAKRISFGGRT